MAVIFKNLLIEEKTEEGKQYILPIINVSMTYLMM